MSDRSGDDPRRPDDERDQRGRDGRDGRDGEVPDGAAPGPAVPAQADQEQVADEQVADDHAGERAPTTPLDPGAVDERLRAARGVGAEPPRRQASATWALVAVVAVTALFVVLAVWYLSG